MKITSDRSADADHRFYQGMTQVAAVVIAAVISLPAWPHETTAPAPDAPVVIAGESSSRAVRHGPDHRRRAGRPPDVNVLIAPETEHYPSNYVPDDYRLEDYDGRPDRPTLCRGDSGTTISTRSIACPPGQQPEKSGRTLSTSP